VSDGLTGEAEAWNRLLGALQAEALDEKAPPWLETRIMAEIQALPEPGAIRRFLTWFLNPRPVRISPMMIGLGSAALVAILLVGLRGPGVGSFPSPAPGSGGDVASSGESDSNTVVSVQFALEAPGANSVAVSGDFDGWAGTHVLSDPDGDGVWTGRVLVTPGVYSYMFLLNGSTWTTDPKADRYTQDGFGNRNAVLAVAVPSA
jgi:hypothetical protein